VVTVGARVYLLSLGVSALRYGAGSWESEFVCMCEYARL
jgi:hypothetical protein